MLRVLTALTVLLLSACPSWAAITFTNLQTSSDNVDRTTYTTGSVTPTSGAVVYLGLHITKATTPNEPTDISGTGGFLDVVWTKEATVTFATIASPGRRVSIYSGVPVSGAAGTITVNFGSPTQTSLGWSIMQSSGAATLGYTVETNTGAGNTVQTLTVSLADIAAGNVLLGVIGRNDNSATNPCTGFTELGDTTWTGPNASIESNYLADDASCDWTWAGSTHVGGIIVEVAILPAPSGAVPLRALMGVGL